MKTNLIFIMFICTLPVFAQPQTIPRPLTLQIARVTNNASSVPYNSDYRYHPTSRTNTLNNPPIDEPGNPALNDPRYRNYTNPYGMSNGFGPAAISNGFGRGAITNGFGSGINTNGFGYNAITNEFGTGFSTNGFGDGGITNGTEDLTNFDNHFGYVTNYGRNYFDHTNRHRPPFTIDPRVMGTNGPVNTNSL